MYWLFSEANLNCDGQMGKMGEMIKTFQFPPIWRGLALMGVLLLAFMTFIDLYDRISAPYTPLLQDAAWPYFLALTLLLLWFIIFHNLRIFTTEEEVGSRWLGREKRLQWDDVARLTSLSAAGHVQFSDAAGSQPIRSYAQMENHHQLVVESWRIRPDLWETQFKTSFERPVWILPSLLVMGLILWAGAVYGWVTQLVDGWLLLGLFVAGGLLLVRQLLAIRTLVLQDDRLVLSGWCRTIMIDAAEIQQIFLTDGGYTSKVIVQCDKRQIELPLFREGPYILSYSLLNWWAQKLGLAFEPASLISHDDE